MRRPRISGSFRSWKVPNGLNGTVSTRKNWPSIKFCNRSDSSASKVCPALISQILRWEPVAILDTGRHLITKCSHTRRVETVEVTLVRSPSKFALANVLIVDKCEWKEDRRRVSRRFLHLHDSIASLYHRRNHPIISGFTPSVGKTVGAKYAGNLYHEVQHDNGDRYVVRSLRAALHGFWTLFAHSLPVDQRNYVNIELV